MFPGQLVQLEAISFENFNFNRLNIDFSYIPSGTFIMGSPTTDAESYEDERPQHKVTLTKPFLMQRTPVTQNQFFIVMGRPFLHSNVRNRPVDNVSWFDEIEFCNKLSSKMGLPHAYITADNSVHLVENSPGYRLPPEAEWEYACRAGTTDPRYGTLGKIAWHHGISSYETHEVGQKTANAWNLYDMLGNVWEWIYHTSDSLYFPQAVAGGSFESASGVLRSSYIVKYDAPTESPYFGFRIYRNGPGYIPAGVAK